MVLTLKQLNLVSQNNMDMGLLNQRVILTLFPTAYSFPLCYQGNLVKTQIIKKKHVYEAKKSVISNTPVGNRVNSMHLWSAGTDLMISCSVSTQKIFSLF